MTLLGDRTTFAVEVGEAVSRDLRVVGLWAAGRLLTAVDDVAYVPSLLHAMRSTASRVGRCEVPPCPFPLQTPEVIFRLLRADQTDFRERFWFLQWGETLDNVSRYAYLDGSDLVIILAFQGDPNVFVARLALDEFSATVAEAIDLLS